MSDAVSFNKGSASILDIWSKPEQKPGSNNADFWAKTDIFTENRKIQEYQAASQGCSYHS